MEDDTKEKEILAIIQREKDHSFWRRINFVIEKARGGLVWRVLTENGDDEGALSKHLTQETVQEAIFTNIYCKRFFLAEAAPICSGNLQGRFRYNSTTRLFSMALTSFPLTSIRQPGRFSWNTQESGK